MRGVRLALCIASAAVACPSARAAQTTIPPTVLVLFSLRSTAPAVAEIEGSFRGEVEKAYGAPVDLHIEHLDLPDAAVVPYARRLVDVLREKYAGRRLDVVVAEEGQALRFLLENREALFPGVPVVFTDVTRRSIAGLSLPPDVTGAFLVLEGQTHGPTSPSTFTPGRQPRRSSSAAPPPYRPGERAPSPTASRPGQGAAARAVRRSRRRPAAWTSSLRRLAALPDDSVVIFATYRADIARAVHGDSRDVLRLVTRASSAPTSTQPLRAWLGHRDRRRRSHSTYGRLRRSRTAGLDHPASSAASRPASLAPDRASRPAR